MKRQKLIHAKLEVAGTHRWSLHDGFLKHEHRHLFTLRAFVEVTHDDRDVEFFELRSRIARFVEAQSYSKTKTGEVRFGERSCEHIATELFDHLEQHGLNVHSCEVLEDNESGAIVRKEDH